MSEENIINLGDNIIERVETIQVGPGEFDKIGIHRITKDIATYKRHIKATVVAVPGANSDFDTSFQRMAIYLARHGIDVWGIDFRYSFVPDNTSDGYPYCISSQEACNFMKDWNTDLHLSDINNVVKIAEMSSRTGQVILMGWSQGALFAYKYAERYPVQGIIPIDIAYNIDPTLTDFINSTTAEVDRISSLIASGIYYEDVLALKYMASLAYSDPDGQSAVIPGLTNREAFLFAVTMTYQLPTYNPPNFRYAQGDLTSLKYTDYNFLIGQAFKLNSFESMVTTLENYRTMLDPNTIPNITVPILYVGAEFGFGDSGLYTPYRIHEYNPNVDAIIIPDYGHADLMYSSTADKDVWKYILRWIKG